VQAAANAAVEVGDVAVPLRRDERADAFDEAVQVALAPGRLGGRVDGDALAALTRPQVLGLGR
jgi:hypothetical protein